MKIYLKAKTTLTCTLCLLLLLCGCSSATQKGAASSPAQPTDATHPQAAAAAPDQPAEQADSITLSIAEDPADASPAAPAPASTASSADPREEVPALLSARQEEACTIGVTRILREKNDDGTWTHTYFNKDVDFTGLGLEVLQYSFTGDTPALRLKVTFPEHWDSDTRSWMQKEGLKLSFRMGDLPVDAYRQRSISSLEDGFLVEYARCLLTEEDYAAYKGLYICPYVEQYSTLNWYDQAARRITETKNLPEGDIFTTTYLGKATIGRQYIFEMGDISRTDLSDCTMGLPFPLTQYKAKTPVYYPLNVVEPLWEENIKNGVYIENAQIPELAKSSLVYKDFSKVRFVLDTLHIWEEEFLLVYSVYFPEDWSLYERRSFIQDSTFGISYSLDGSCQPNLRLNTSPPSPIYFGSSGQYTGGSKDEQEFYVDHTNYTTMTIPCLHFRNWFSKLSVDDWSSIHNLALIPSYGTYTEVKLNMNDPASVPYTPLTESPITIEYGWGKREYFMMDELAISIDITPDLFDCGF